jgi:hypothetical protein
VVAFHGGHSSMTSSGMSDIFRSEIFLSCHRVFK